jgi:hypothetical protein
MVVDEAPWRATTVAATHYKSSLALDNEIGSANNQHYENCLALDLSLDGTWRLSVVPVP